MAQNALELFKRIKLDPTLKFDTVDIKPNYVNTQPMDDNSGYYEMQPDEPMNFFPLSIEGEGAATKRGHNFSGNLHLDMPLNNGSLSGNVGGNFYKEGPFKGGSLSNADLMYNTDKFSVGGEYQNPDFSGQNYLARGLYRW